MRRRWFETRFRWLVLAIWAAIVVNGCRVMVNDLAADTIVDNNTKVDVESVM